jgi:hypothetical protein
MNAKIRRMPWGGTARVEDIKGRASFLLMEEPENGALGVLAVYSLLRRRTS